MLNAFESSLMVAGSIVGAILLLRQLRRVWPPLARKQYNHLIGWQISQLPGVFWLVLIGGGAIIVAYTCLLGVENYRIHVLQVVTTVLVVSLVLVTIADVDQPFRGAIHVSSDPFRIALQTFDAAP